MNMQAMLKQAQALQKDMLKVKNEIDSIYNSNKSAIKKAKDMISNDDLEEYVGIIKKSETNKFKSDKLAAALLKMIREN